MYFHPSNIFLGIKKCEEHIMVEDLTQMLRLH